MWAGQNEDHQADWAVRVVGRRWRGLGSCRCGCGFEKPEPHGRISVHHELDMLLGDPCSPSAIEAQQTLLLWWRPSPICSVFDFTGGGRPHAMNGLDTTAAIAP